jgi:hypothetical protein
MRIWSLYNKITSNKITWEQFKQIKLLRGKYEI